MPRRAEVIIEHAEALAEADPAAGAHTEPALQALRDAVIARGRAEAGIIRALQRARAEGASWTALSAVLGTSRQAAQQRYGDV